MGFCSRRMMCVGLLVVVAATFCASDTDPFDVMAINGLYLSLGSPPLTGWVPVGGDPCGEEWQGVNCVFSNITELRLNGMNLGGILDGSIVNFESIIVLDLSNNHIGGSIPTALPVTLRNFSLSGNQFNGSIPDLSMLSQLLDLSLNDNHLSDGIPDSFQQLISLINLDLSGNNLSGQLPPSFGNLSSLNMLHLQNNTLSGKLNVLQDLPLLDLNVENNLFSGPIPPKLLSIPNFRKDGNPFNTSILAPPPVALPPFVAEVPFVSPSPGLGHGGQTKGSSVLEPPPSEKGRSFWSNKGRLTWIVVSGVLALVILGVCLLVWRCSKGRQANENDEKHGMDALQEPTGKPSHSNKSSFQPTVQMKKESGRTAPSLKLQEEYVIDVMKMPTNLRNKKDHEIDMKGVEMNSMTRKSTVPDPPFPPVEGVNVSPVVPALLKRGGHASTSQNSAFSMTRKSTVPDPPFPPVEGVNVSPVVPALVKRGGHASTSQNSAFSTSVFTIASLQQYTNSFSEDNFIGEGMLGSVYLAELPDGKLLAIKKLDSKASGCWNEEDFLELVSNISKLKHPNILELMGYCNEHGQQLLVYEYCRHGSLYDALHIDDDIHRKLSWDARVRVALGAARALQYLHEVCQPPIMHRNLKSSNVLLDDKFAAHVSDCILALLSSSADQLSGSLISLGYGAPELEIGSYTCQSDVYSLGIVMLELLTGRKPFDRSQSRGEQSLVGWAIPKLHDIDALSKMVDPSLNGAYPVKSLSRFADIISRCVQWEPGFRPPMSEIVQDLLHMI